MGELSINNLLAELHKICKVNRILANAFSLKKAQANCHRKSINNNQIKLNSRLKSLTYQRSIAHLRLLIKRNHRKIKHSNRAILINLKISPKTRIRQKNLKRSLVMTNMMIMIKFRVQSIVNDKIKMKKTMKKKVIIIE